MRLVNSSAAVCWRCTLGRSTVRPLVNSLPLRRNVFVKRNYVADTASAEIKNDLDHTRNIGIIAHIDAGKTTTTERMLYYSGLTRRIGDVDQGDTVMDYLPAERARGITITSACITFPWNNNTINLIDTPGHADFTFEVERSIRVLDGAVTILDGVAGVEAQTEKVWRQAARYDIPRLVFVNKMDRTGAAFGRTVKEVAAKLGTWPLVCQIPIFEGPRGEETFRGIIDIVGKKVFKWDVGTDGRNVQVEGYEWLEKNNPTLHEEALKARVALVETLTQYDDVLVETFLEIGDHHEISESEIKAAIRRQVLGGHGKVVPVFCGASFRNIGVQPLLDAVVDYLPSPKERPPTEVSYAGQESTSLLDTANDFLCALAFKVVNDPRRGPMVFVRVYSGTLNRGIMLFNTNLAERERAQRLLRMYADDAVEIPSISTGNIGVIVGLKHTRTGDTLISEQHAGKHPHMHHGSKKKNKKIKTPQVKLHSTMQLKPINVPPPVFFAAIEPASLSDEKAVEDALGILLREDPSLHVRVDDQTGQTLLSGMGELHLEIARDRLIKDLKANAEMGKILIGYRETVTDVFAPAERLRKVYEREIAGKLMKAGASAEIYPADYEYEAPEDYESETIDMPDGNKVTINIRPEDPFTPEDGGPVVKPEAVLPATLPYGELRSAYLSGAEAALARGPKLGFPMHSTHVVLEFHPSCDYYGPTDSSHGALTSAARVAVVAAFKEAHAAGQTSLMEPLMDVAISVDENYVGNVVNDISGARGGHVYSLDDATASGAPEHDTGPEINLARVYVPPDVDGRADKAAVGGADQVKIVRAKVPLAEMVGYLKHLRSISQGRGTFVMSVDQFVKMGPQRERVVLGDKIW